MRNSAKMKNIVTQIISEQLGVEQDSIKRSNYLVEDLGADSLDLVELVMIFEEEFECIITDTVAKKVKTVGDVIRLLDQFRGNDLPPVSDELDETPPPPIIKKQNQKYRIRPPKHQILVFGDDLKYIFLWMDLAERLADESSSTRSKVGCVIATKGGGLYTGYNGTYPGEDNTCETNDVTNDNVYHAEENAFDKMLLDRTSPEGSIIVLTHSPCIKCAKRILKAKPKLVVFKEFYRCSDGIEFLRSQNVACHELSYFS